MYTKKIFRKHFLNYLGPLNFNAVPLYPEKNIVSNVNKKSNYMIYNNFIVEWLLSEL